MSIGSIREEIARSKRASIAFNDVADAWDHFKLLEPNATEHVYKKALKVYEELAGTLQYSVQKPTEKELAVAIHAYRSVDKDVHNEHR